MDRFNGVLSLPRHVVLIRRWFLRSYAAKDPETSRTFVVGRLWLRVGKPKTDSGLFRGLA